MMNLNSEHIGVVGKKICVKARIINIYSFANNYSYYGGVSYIYNMEDMNGNSIVWKTSISMVDINLNDEEYYIKKGDIVLISGIVKEHSIYRDCKQTVLSRCKYCLEDKGSSEEELREIDKKNQINSISDKDEIKTVLYRDFKNNKEFENCEVVIDSFKRVNGNAYIDVIIRG